MAQYFPDPIYCKRILKVEFNLKICWICKDFQKAIRIETFKSAKKL